EQRSIPRMAFLLPGCGGGRLLWHGGSVAWLGWPGLLSRVARVLVMASGGRPVRNLRGVGRRLDTGHLLDRAGDPRQRRAEIGYVDECQDQAGDPEDVLVREQGDEAQDRDHLHLHLVRLVRDLLGQRVQPEEKDA